MAAALQGDCGMQDLGDGYPFGSRKLGLQNRSYFKLRHYPCCSTRSNQMGALAFSKSTGEPKAPLLPIRQIAPPFRDRPQRVNWLSIDGISGCVLYRHEALPGNRLAAWQELPGSTSKPVAVVSASGRFPVVSITFYVLVGRPYCAAAFSNYLREIKRLPWRRREFAPLNAIQTIGSALGRRVRKPPPEP
jgi:hypothetical protein